MRRPHWASLVQVQPLQDYQPLRHSLIRILLLRTRSALGGLGGCAPRASTRSRSSRRTSLLLPSQPTASSPSSSRPLLRAASCELKRRDRERGGREREREKEDPLTPPIRMPYHARRRGGWGPLPALQPVQASCAPSCSHHLTEVIPAARMGWEHTSPRGGSRRGESMWGGALRRIEPRGVPGCLLLSIAPIDITSNKTMGV